MPKRKTSKVISKKHLARLERERIQNRNIIIVSTIILVFVVGLIGYGILDQTVLQGLKPVAKVGSQVITSREFQVQVRYDRMNLINQYNQYQQLAQYFSGDATFQNTMTQIENQLSSTTTEGSTVLNNLVNDILIRQEAQRRGITVSQAEIDAELQKGFAYFPNGTLTPTTTPTVVNTPTLNPTALFLVTALPTATTTSTVTPAALSATPTAPATSTPTATAGPSSTPTATSTPYTLKGYQTSVASYLGTVQPYGFTNADLRKLIESSLYRQKVMDAVTADLKPQQEQVWARHILVADQATADAIEAQLKTGADFAQLATQKSTDTGSAPNGGDLGWFGKGVMDTTFETAAFNLQVGQISQPIKTQFGYHIIQVLGHQLRPLDASSFQTYKQNFFNTWLTNLQNANSAIIQKYDTVWTAIVPTDPTFVAPAATAAPN
jgi:parvulin-like peptidyl-prolyl isomerase